MSAFDAYCELDGSIDGTILCDERMARHTTYQIGGPAALYVECASTGDITRTLAVLSRYGLPWTIVGKGSNILVADEGYEGAVLTLGREFRSYSFPSRDEADLNTVVAGGGVILSRLVQDAFKNGYAGFEFAVGVPGTLGGALFMNAGTREEWIGSIVESITVLRPGSGLVRYRKGDLPWHYRNAGIPLGEVVVEAAMCVKPGPIPQIRAKMEASLKRRKKSQPLTLPNAGSIFRNPPGTSAGKLIEDLGLKGMRIGGAQVSEVHANFIVNVDNASAADIVEIIVTIRNRVKEVYGIELQPEVRFLGFPVS